MTLEGPDGDPHLVRRDGSLVTEDDGYPRPVKLSELAPDSARIVRRLIEAERFHGPARDEGCEGA